MKIPTAGNRGHHTLSMGGTLEFPPITITATIYEANKRFPQEYQIPSTSITDKSQIQK